MVMTQIDYVLTSNQCGLFAFAAKICGVNPSLRIVCINEAIIESAYSSRQ